MTERDWLDLSGPEDLYGELAAVAQPRRLFLLGTAFLTRVRESIRDQAVLFAVDATRDYVGGRASVLRLLECWTAAEQATGQYIWIDAQSVPDMDRYWCRCCWGPPEWEQVDCQGISPLVRKGIRDPAWHAARAAWYALDLVADAAPRKKREKRRAAERSAQWHVFRDLIGDPSAAATPCPVPPSGGPAVAPLLKALQGGYDPVTLLALADAMEEAGCRDAALLAHLREAGPHFEGCWAVERAAGRETFALPLDGEAVSPLDRYEGRPAWW